MIPLLLSLVGLVAVLILVVMVIGSRLPREHQATVEIELPISPAAAFEMLLDVEKMPSWRSNLKRIEKVSPTRHREFTSQGTLTLEAIESQPPRLLVRKIVDENLPFGGSWRFELNPRGDGCVVRITEDGWVRPALFRFLMRYVFGEDKQLKLFAQQMQGAARR